MGKKTKKPPIVTPSPGSNSPGNVREENNAIVEIENQMSTVPSKASPTAPPQASPTASPKASLTTPSKASPTVEVQRKPIEQTKDIKKVTTKTEDALRLPAKSKEEVMAERKAKQEAKRNKKAEAAAKPEAETEKKPIPTPQNPTPTPQKSNPLPQKSTPTPQKSTSTPQKPSVQSSTSETLSQQPRRVRFESQTTTETRIVRSSPVSVSGLTPSSDPLDIVHPAFLSFSARVRAGCIIGVDALCQEFVFAFKSYVNDFVKSPDKDFAHDLDMVIRPQLSYLTASGRSRFPLAIGNLIRQLKKEINGLPNDIKEAEGREKVVAWIDEFLCQYFDLAIRAISIFTQEKLQRATNVLTYSWCPVVERILLDAHTNGMNFHITILDSPGDRKGKKMAHALCQRGVSCTYALLSSIGYAIKDCSMVLMGCSAVLSNGQVVVTRGGSQVALVARSFNVPILIAAQTYKFVEKVDASSVSHLWPPNNNPQHSIDVDCQSWNIPNPLLEAVPDDLISAIVTEIRILPPSSAPAVLKAKQFVVT